MSFRIPSAGVILRVITVDKALSCSVPIFLVLLTRARLFQYGFRGHVRVDVDSTAPHLAHDDRELPIDRENTLDVELVWAPIHAGLVLADEQT
jgi:hypothetical protein